MKVLLYNLLQYYYCYDIVTIIICRLTTGLPYDPQAYGYKNLSKFPNQYFWSAYHHIFGDWLLLLIQMTCSSIFLMRTSEKMLAKSWTAQFNFQLPQITAKDLIVQPIICSAQLLWQSMRQRKIKCLSSCEMMTPLGILQFIATCRIPKL